jgi:hypothetical protein
MLNAFSDILEFEQAELIDDFDIIFGEVTIKKPIGGIASGKYISVSFNFNKGEATVYNYEGDTIATGRFCVSPVT